MTPRVPVRACTSRSVGRWLLPGLLAGLALVVGCSAGDDDSQGSSPTTTPAAVEARRWGYNPLVPSGEEDPPVPERPLPDDYRIEQVVTGLDRPTQLAVTRDGRLLVAEQAGAVHVVQDGRLLDEPFASVDVYLPELDIVVELGLAGIAVDPEFEQHPYIYLFYAADRPRRTVIARVREENGRGGEIEEIFSWEEAPECCHIGGGMRFAPDGTLFIGVGDHERSLTAQDPATLPGSVLRIDRDGGAPPDNPFVGDERADPRVYAYGLRNPYDIAIDPESGRIFAGENGFFGQDAIVEIKAGANYGWPGFDLRVPEEQIEEPLAFYHTAGGTAGMEFYSSDVLSDLQGHLLFCRFHSGTVHDIEFAPDGSVRQETVLARRCYTDIITGPEGFLYFLDYAEGALYRIAVAGE